MSQKWCKIETSLQWNILTRRALGRAHYLRQRCSDGSVNKTILKLRLAAAAGRQYVYRYVGFSRRKIPRTISKKAIRFRHPDYNPDRAQKLIRSSMSRHLSTCNVSSKSMHAFLVVWLTDKQTNKHGQKHLPSPLSEVISTHTRSTEGYHFDLE